MAKQIEGVIIFFLVINSMLQTNLEKLATEKEEIQKRVESIREEKQQLERDKREHEQQKEKWKTEKMDLVLENEKLSMELQGARSLNREVELLWLLFLYHSSFSPSSW